MTTKQVKSQLEKYLGLSFELKNQLQYLAHLQQLDHNSIRLQGSRSEEYATQIAPIVQANRREMKVIESAVEALKNPLEREVLRLRYLNPSIDPQTGKQSVRHTTWSEIAFSLYGECVPAVQKRAIRLHNKAITHLTAHWPKIEQ